MIERELTAPASLTLPNGKLNREAVGWMRQPLLDTSGIGNGRFWGRNKRWEYWNVITPTHILALTVSSIDYAAVHEVWVFDRASERVWSKNISAIGGTATLPGSLEGGPSRARAKGLAIDIDEVEGGTRLQATIEGASFDVVAALPEGHERLGVVVPWTEVLFQYTVKDVARPASGSVTIDGETFAVPASQSWAVLDHGRGRWPYDIAWNWGGGSGVSHGRTIGIQVGARWTAGTGSTENSFLVDGRLHKISEELTWRYDLANWREPWRITGGGLDAVFTPFYNKHSKADFVIISSRTEQCFGSWSGTFVDVSGASIPFEGIVGFAEDVHNRW